MASWFGKLKRTLFAHHSNPWSAWTRWASTPLFLVPFWTRKGRHVAPLVTWAVLNPMIFPVPATTDAWSTRAMLGEELWIAARPRDRLAIVSSAASLCGAGAALAAWRHRLVPAAALTAAEMALLLVSWELMARYYDEHRGDVGNSWR